MLHSDFFSNPFLAIELFALMVVMMEDGLLLFGSFPGGFYAAETTSRSLIQTSKA